MGAPGTRTAFVPLSCLRRGVRSLALQDVVRTQPVLPFSAVRFASTVLAEAVATLPFTAFHRLSPPFTAVLLFRSQHGRSIEPPASVLLRVTDLGV